LFDASNESLSSEIHGDFSITSPMHNVGRRAAVPTKLRVRNLK
jgi:hypothetical protein